MNLLDKDIGKRLKDARKTSKLTFDEVTKRIKISKQSLMNYEKGKGNPSLHNIIELCNLYEITPNFLIYGEDKNISNISSSFKRKIYNLAAIDSDGDISYDSIKGTIIFNNSELKKYFSYCHAMFSRNKEFTKLEIIEKILNYLDQEIK